MSHHQSTAQALDVEALVRQLDPAARPSSTGWTLRCPAHDDSHASCSITRGRERVLVVRCHAGCTQDAVLDAIAAKCSVPRGLLSSPVDGAGLSNGTPTPKIVTLPPPRTWPPEWGRVGGNVSAKYVYVDENGSPVAGAVRVDELRPEGGVKKSFRQCRVVVGSDGKPGKRCEWSSHPRPPLYRLDLILHSRGRILVTEGEKCVDSLTRLGFVATTSMGGSSAPAKTDWSPLRGRDVVIWPDADDPGRRYADAVAALLDGVAASVAIIEPPEGVPTGWDVADLVAEAPTPVAAIDAVRAAVRAARSSTASVGPFASSSASSPTVSPTAPPPQTAANTPQSATPARPLVVVTPERSKVIKQVLAALAKVQDLYVHGRELVEVVGGESRAVVGPWLSIVVTTCCRFARETDKGVVTIHPPGWIVDGLLAAPLHLHLPPLDLITTEPVIMRDGSLSAPGYRDGVLHLHGGLDVSVPDAPTQGDAVAAAGVLLDVLHDFPFADDAARAAAVAAILTVVGRMAIAGPTPFFALDANVRGTGKGLLRDVIATVATGVPMTVTTYLANNEELDKRITATLRSGCRCSVFDEVEAAFGAPALNNLATAWPTYTGRHLGHSSMLTLPATTVWFLQGNNLEYRKDMVRRVCPVRQQSPEERPEERDGFRYPDLLGHVQAHRGELLAAALTMLRAVLVLPREARPALPRWGSFERWSDVVRTACVYGGLADPFEAKAKLNDEDGDASIAVAVHDLVAAHHGDDGITAAQLETIAKASADVMASLKSLCPHKTVDSRAIGYLLRPYRDRVVGGRKLVGITSRGRAKPLRWSVVREDGSRVTSTFDVSTSKNVVPIRRREHDEPDLDAINQSLLDDLND